MRGMNGPTIVLLIWETSRNAAYSIPLSLATAGRASKAQLSSVAFMLDITSKNSSGYALVVNLIFILWLSWVLSHFLHIPWSTHDVTYTQPQCHSHDPREQAQKGGQEGLTWVGLGWVCLCHSLPQLLATALAYLGHFIPQVHFHWHLHFWVIDKNIGKRILHDRIHLPSRSMELAGFQCYCYGVSSTPLYFLRQ